MRQQSELYDRDEALEILMNYANNYLENGDIENLDESHNFVQRLAKADDNIEDFCEEYLDDIENYCQEAIRKYYEYNNFQNGNYFQRNFNSMKELNRNYDRNFQTFYQYIQEAADLGINIYGDVSGLLSLRKFLDYIILAHEEENNDVRMGYVFEAVSYLAKCGADNPEFVERFFEDLLQRQQQQMSDFVDSYNEVPLSENEFFVQLNLVNQNYLKICRSVIEKFCNENVIQDKSSIYGYVNDVIAMVKNIFPHYNEEIKEVNREIKHWKNRVAFTKDQKQTKSKKKEHYTEKKEEMIKEIKSSIDEICKTINRIENADEFKDQLYDSLQEIVTIDSIGEYIDERRNIIDLEVSIDKSTSSEELEVI